MLKLSCIQQSFLLIINQKQMIMLNKKASKKKNLWKYGIVLPLLVAVMLPLQVTVAAQEKSSLIAKKCIETTIEKTFFPTDSDKQLNEDLQLYSKAYKIEVSLSGIKRNKKGNIKHIIATARDLNNIIAPLKY